MALRESEPEATLHSRSHGRAVLPLSARVTALGAAVVATALVAAAAAQSAPRQRLQAPLRSDIGRATVSINDSTLSAKAAVPAGSWGGTYRVPTGEAVTVYASNAYPVDPAMGQRWADFLDTLVHGSELSSVIVFLAPDAEVGRLCGTDAVACYSSRDNLLVAPGQDPGADLSAEAVVTHEYGHHVAAHRINPPWSALDYGTKRWASAMQVCARAKKGDLAPGAEDPVQYDVNPGEGFAESYRVLNERLAGLAETPWQIVSNILYPSDNALTLLQQDVTNPWSQQAATTSTVRFTPSRADAHVHRRDAARRDDEGVLRSAAGLRVSVDLLAGGKPAASTTGTGTLARSATVCGQRSYKIRVRALRGNGAVTLSVAKP